MGDELWCCGGIASVLVLRILWDVGRGLVVVELVAEPIGRVLAVAVVHCLCVLLRRLEPMAGAVVAVIRCLCFLLPVAFRLLP